MLTRVLPDDKYTEKKDINMIKILLLEDQVIVRESLAKLLNGQEDMKVIAEIGSASKALETCQRHRPDLALMDVVTDSAESGIAAAAELRATFPELKIMIMTGMLEITFIESAKRAGANSFIYKNIKSETLISAIRGTMQGYRIFPENKPYEMPDGISFTKEEVAILKLVCEAKNRSEIAKELAMSEGSLKTAISAILDKTGYDSIMKFAVFAAINGYIIPKI